MGCWRDRRRRVAFLSLATRRGEGDRGTIWGESRPNDEREDTSCEGTIAQVRSGSQMLEIAFDFIAAFCATGCLSGVFQWLCHVRVVPNAARTSAGLGAHTTKHERTSTCLSNSTFRGHHGWLRGAERAEGQKGTRHIVHIVHIVHSTGTRRRRDSRGLLCLHYRILSILLLFELSPRNKGSGHHLQPSRHPLLST